MGIYDELANLEKPVEALPVESTSPVTTSPARERRAPRAASIKPSSPTPVTPDGMHDVVTSLLEGVDVPRWRDLLTDTETHNSALRLSAAERDDVEDLVRDLRRVERIKTSMNELARLGLLLLVDDFRRRGSKSVIHRVKKP
jgi:hypothetical protein